MRVSSSNGRCTLSANPSGSVPLVPPMTPMSTPLLLLRPRSQVTVFSSFTTSRRNVVATTT